MPTGAMKRLFVESSSSAAASNSGREAAVLCAPRPRRVQVHPCSADLILGPPPFLLSSNNTNKQREGKSKEEEEEGRWEMFGGSPPARADNPLVHDPHFLLNQRPHAAAAAAAPELSIFDHRSTHHGHHPAYSSSSSFAPSFAPAVRIQGFDVAACRSSHGSGGGGRVLSARA
ncbi:unknown protein [Oryza sativa Japonica Group]|uniref:Os01g0930200 protein n=3 Tax=Oryza TaxID=4527 RepID=A3A171_ORYSJ|nr:uncharacterized protein LOC4326943 [Oryza sativa Japonica Group]KAB8085036.1 hypothetical protein EE612_007750 [Oryza sativa]EAZ14718.1 hypothetical protein OsJ_04643 [Oryza sativa Japonica Group]KAF2954136.1 hypothetical protein DAI22_01g458200 [Oryza sativa Japonica Group]BAD87320.1 unknown protein [Oryza sativa Japonica Group]BAD88176.1 unknown protein [Oryza sativa Japonica Group]|eukprot:NP_001045286.1 Os01g0930200 [Oryza sativa Japonica Group]